MSLQDFGDLHVEALRVFSNCLRDSESVQEIHRKGGLERLVEFLLTSTEPEIHLNATKCITRVAEHCKYDGRNALFFWLCERMLDPVGNSLCCLFCAHVIGLVVFSRQSKTQKAQCGEGSGESPVH